MAGDAVVSKLMQYTWGEGVGFRDRVPGCVLVGDWVRRARLHVDAWERLALGVLLARHGC